MTLSTKLLNPRWIPLQRRTWKSEEASTWQQLALIVNLRCHVIPADVESVWKDIQSELPNAINKTSGWAKGGHQRHKKTWWWIEVVSDAVNEKRKTWKLLENGGSKEEYLEANKKTKTAIYIAKRDLEQFTRINKNKIFKLPKSLKGEISDIVGEKCSCNDEGMFALTLNKLQVLKCLYCWFIKWGSACSGTSDKIYQRNVWKAIRKMKIGKPTSSSDIISEMIKATRNQFVNYLTSLFN